MEWFRLFRPQINQISTLYKQLCAG